MAEEKKGIRPDGNQEMEARKLNEKRLADKDENSDVEGQQYSVRVRCWCCDSINRAPSHWDWFSCGYCGAINYF